MWQKAAQKCSLNGLRVLLFLLTHKDKNEWIATSFISWIGMEYPQGKKTWDVGVANLVQNELVEIKGGEILVKKIKE